MTAHASRAQGALIVLEGPDGSGTTTHAKLLAHRLSEEYGNVVYTAEPTSGPIGSAIRQFLKNGDLPQDALQLLFTADRACHVAQEILPAIENGTLIVADRYLLSTLAYGEAMGLDPQWLHDLNKKFIQPVCTILTLPSVDVCMKRIGERGMHDAFEVRDTQERVHAAYRRLAGQEPRTTIVDTAKPTDEAAKDILTAVRTALA